MFYLIVTHNQESLPQLFPLLLKIFTQKDILLGKRDFTMVLGGWKKVPSVLKQHPCTAKPYLIDFECPWGPAQCLAHRGPHASDKLLHFF